MERARRTIPIDKALARSLAHQVTESLARMLAEVPYEDPGTGLPDSEAVEQWAFRQRGRMRLEGLQVRREEVGEYAIDSVQGKRRHVAVYAELFYAPQRGAGLLKAWIEDSPSGRWLGLHVIVNIAHHEAPELRDHPTAYVARIESLIIHEMTHVRDVIREKDVVPIGVVSFSGGTSQDERWAERYKAYFNSPHEVRAYMQQVVAESLRPAMVLWAQRRAQASRTPNATIVDEVVEKSPTWQKVARFLTERNKQRILLAVAQALAEGGHLYERPRGVPAPLPVPRGRR